MARKSRPGQYAKLTESQKAARKAYAARYEKLSRTKEYRKKYSQRPEVRERIKAWSRHYQLQKKYGLTPDVYKSMLIAQGSVCAICKLPDWGGRDPAVDHNHTTGKVRGILCSNCNTAVGLLRENPNIARALAIYLEKAE